MQRLRVVMTFMKIHELKNGGRYQRIIRKLKEIVMPVKRIVSWLKWYALAPRSEIKLKKRVKTGEIVIIPAGFRCWTKGHIYNNLRVKQPSLPFDTGFFTPSAIASILKNPRINLEYDDNNSTHFVCIKSEGYEDSAVGYGIKFERASYSEINSLAISRDMGDINRYLDDTFGYYTLDVKHNFVLAHYNWHKFSNNDKSNRIHDPKINLERINEILNRRIQRMFKMCKSASYIFFIVGEFQEYQYMMIDDKYYDLNCFKEIINAAELAFNARCFVVKVADVDSAAKLLAMID